MKWNELRQGEYGRRSVVKPAFLTNSCCKARAFRLRNRCVDLFFRLASSLDRYRQSVLGRKITAVRTRNDSAIRMTMMKIDVTWHDILAGKSMRTTECMVALALKRELGIGYASVGLRDVRIRIDGRYMTLRLPREVGRKIWYWERFHFVFPFSFDFGLGGWLSANQPALLETHLEACSH
jgi:hypothetical protein